MKEPLFKNTTPDPIETYLSSIRNILPAFDEMLARHENTKLGDYVEQLNRHNTTGFQDKQDFIAEVGKYTHETLGPELAQVISEELQESPKVLTANHHGIDTFAQSTQTNLLFSLRKGMDGKPARQCRC